MSKYVTVYPENLKQEYKAFDSIDMVMTFENMELVPNSVRIEADLTVYKDSGTTQLDNDIVCIDSKVAGHTFFSSIQTDFQSSGNVENFQEYPRYVRMVSDVTLRPDDHNNSEAVCELRSPSDTLTNLNLQGIASNYKASGSDVASPDFSIKPKFCLNNMSGPLSYSKSGAIRVNLKLARDESALYLRGSTSGPTDAIRQSHYVLKNVRLCYMVQPPSKRVGKVNMRTKLNIKQAVLSQFANISTKVPAVCTAVSCSFQKQTSENNILFKNTQTEVLPNVSELQFLFNDSQNQYITFVIKDNAELLSRYIESFVDSGSNDVSLKNLMHNESYGIGLNFGSPIDLSNQKFNVQLTSTVDSGKPYTLYMYFHSVVSM